MTPDDFMRSITPGVIQPKGLGLDRFRNLTVEVGQSAVVVLKHKKHVHVITVES